jgi:hypothetical protein
VSTSREISFSHSLDKPGNKSLDGWRLSELALTRQVLPESKTSLSKRLVCRKVTCSILQQRNPLQTSRRSLHQHRQVRSGILRSVRKHTLALEHFQKFFSCKPRSINPSTDTLSPQLSCRDKARKTGRPADRQTECKSSNTRLLSAPLATRPSHFLDNDQQGRLPLRTTALSQVPLTQAQGSLQLLSGAGIVPFAARIAGRFENNTGV